MTRASRNVCCFFFVLMLTAPVMAQDGGPKLPAYKKTVLKNGLTLLLMEQHEVPVISMSVLVKAGSVADPAGKEGVAVLTAALLRKGTKGRSADQFSSDIDFIGGSFGASASRDAMILWAEFMKKDITRGLNLVSESLMQPTFPQDELTKIVKQSIDGIKSAKDQARGVIDTYYDRYLYGGHPYARSPFGDESSLASITRDDVTGFYDAFYTPDSTVMAVVGDFVTADMEAALMAAFGAWPSKTAPAVMVTAASPARGKKLLLVDKPDSTQTYFRIGNIGIARSHPDRVPIKVVNTLFGGRFNSMINNELRTKSGLTYGAWSFFAEWKAPGPFAISTFTANAKTGEVIDRILDVLGRLHRKGISPDQLRSAQAYLKGRFPFSIETNGQLAGLLAYLVFNGLDEREVDTYYEKVDNTTMDDVNRVIQQHFPLNDLVFTLIGKASEIEETVKKYAPVFEKKSISDPGF